MLRDAGALTEVGLTVTDATGTGATVMVAEAVFPSLVAAMVTVPGATAVTRPVDATVATDVLEDAHVTWRPVSVAPALSRAVAVSCLVCETSTVADDGDTTTVATGTGVTVTATVCETLAAPKPGALGVLAVTVIVAEPGATAVTTPVVDTVATAGVDELYAMFAPGAPDGWVTDTTS